MSRSCHSEWILAKALHTILALLIHQGWQWVLQELLQLPGDICPLLPAPTHMQMVFQIVREDLRVFWYFHPSFLGHWK